MSSHYEPLGRVRTKIVATVGPASRYPETLRALVEAGVDVFRLNFSHSNHQDHAEVLCDISRPNTGRSICKAACAISLVHATL